MNELLTGQEKRGDFETAPRLAAAIYVRVSTDDKGQDPLNQVLQLREFCSRFGWKIVAQYTDEASAKNGDRPAFRKMWKDAAQRRFDVLAFWSLDRLSREGTLMTLTYLQRLKDHGIAFKSFTEQYIDSLGVFSDAVIGILAAVAQQERIRMSERTKAGLQRARMQGKQLGRPEIQRNPSRTTLWRRAKKLMRREES